MNTPFGDGVPSQENVCCSNLFMQAGSSLLLIAGQAVFTYSHGTVIEKDTRMLQWSMDSCTWN